MGVAEDIGRDTLKLRGSRAFPRPRVMNKRLRNLLQTRGPKWKAETRDLRTKYLRNYRRQWRNSILKTNRKDRLTALRRGMELNPATVYGIGKGKVSAAAMAGKGESRGIGAADLKKLLRIKGLLTSKNTANMSTIDFSGASTFEKNAALGMTGAIKDLLMKDEVYSDSSDSESDSEIDDLDDDQ